MGIILSPDSVNSDWVNKELNAGLIREIKKKEVVVLPILYEPCEIPPLLSDKKYADFTKGYKIGFDDLLNVFNIDKTQRQEIKTAKGHMILDNKINNVYYDNIVENVFHI